MPIEHKPRHLAKLLWGRQERKSLFYGLLNALDDEIDRIARNEKRGNPDYGNVVICPARGMWFIVDGMEDDGAVYLHGDREFLGPIPRSNLIHLGVTSDRFWDGDKFITGNYWELVNGADYHDLVPPEIRKRNRERNDP